MKFKNLTLSTPNITFLEILLDAAVCLNLTLDDSLN